MSLIQQNIPMIKLTPFHWKIVFYFMITLSLLACGPARSPDEESQVTEKKNNHETPTPTDGTKDTAYFLLRMASPRELAIPHPNETMVLRSSHNPDQPEDADVFHGEYEMDGVTWKTVLDEKGPGCVTRMWFSGNAQGRLRIYFDREDEPRVDTTIEEFYNGGYREYLKEMLVFPENRSGYGFISYFPMPFARHCTVMVSDETPNLKYQFNILKYKEEEIIKTFHPTLDDSTMRAYEHANQFMSYLAAHHFRNKSMTSEDEITIPANERKMIANIPGPAGLDYFVMNVTPQENNVLNGVQMQIYWDNLNKPAVDCTLAQFFGHAKVDALPENRWTSLYLGYLQEQNMFYSQFYMPFKKKAQIFFENSSATDISVKLAYHLDLDNNPEDFHYFYARSNHRDIRIGFLYPLIEFEGKGNFVGLSLHAESQQEVDPFFFMEGDELIYIDGEGDPSLVGTGLDNYFNGDDRFKNAAYFMTPTHGTVWKKVDSVTGEINSYRFHNLDSIPFETSLMYVQEAGCPIQYSQMEEISHGEFSWTCYLYGIPAAEKVPRNEKLYYFVLNDEELGAPTPNSPLMRQGKVNMKVPPGRWWIHYAPIQNLEIVEHRLLREQ